MVQTSPLQRLFEKQFWALGPISVSCHIGLSVSF